MAWVTVSKDAGAGGGAESAPLNASVTGIKFEFYDAPSSTRQSEGTTSGTVDATSAGLKLMRAIVTVARPTPVANYKKVHLFYEYPWNSDAEAFTLDGTSALDGTLQVNPEWQHVDGGLRTFDTAKASQDFVIDGLEAPGVDTRFGVYAVSASNTRENELHRATEGASASPHLVVTAHPFTGVGVSGEEFARVVRLLTTEADVVQYDIDSAGNDVFGYVANWLDPVDDQNFSGVVITEVTDVFGERVMGITGQDGEFHTGVNFSLASGPWTGELHFYSYNQDPYARRNTYVAGLTPTLRFKADRRVGPAGQEVAPYVTNVQASVWYDYSADSGELQYGFDMSWDLPTDRSKYRGCRPVARPITTGGDDRALGNEFDGSTALISGPWTMPHGGPFVFDIYFVSLDGNGRANTIVAGTPKVTVTATETAGPVGREVAPYVTGVSASVFYELSADSGDQLYGFDLSWTPPTDLVKYRGMRPICRPITTGGPDRVLGNEVYDSTSARFGPWALPHGGPFDFDIYFLSKDANNRANSITGTTPKVRVTASEDTGASGNEVAPNVTFFSAAIVPGFDDLGGQTYAIQGIWTPPADTSRWRGVKIVVRWSGGTGDVTLNTYTSGETSFQSDYWPVMSSNTAQVYCVSVDSNNRANSITVGTPSSTVSVAKNVTGKLDLTRFDSSKVTTEFRVNPTTGKFEINNVDFTKGTSFDSSFFQVSGSAFTLKDLAADKIKTGILSVGGGGGKVSKFAVFDTLNNLIGWIGDDTGSSGFIGAWFKRMLIGGTSPATAKLIADASGNLAIVNATFSLTSGTVVVGIDGTTLNSDVTALYCKTTGNADVVYIAPGKIGMLSSTSGGTKFFLTAAGTLDPVMQMLANSQNGAGLRFAANGTGGQIRLLPVGGVTNIELNSANGILVNGSTGVDIEVAGSSYYYADGLQGKTVVISYLKSPSGSGTMTFTKGILTAST